MIFSLSFLRFMILRGLSSSLYLFLFYLYFSRSVLKSEPSLCLMMSLYMTYLFIFYLFSLSRRECSLLTLFKLYFGSRTWPTILPALAFLEFDFFVLLDSLLRGSWSTNYLFFCGIGTKSSKLGSEIKLWLFLLDRSLVDLTKLTQTGWF